MSGLSIGGQALPHAWARLKQRLNALYAGMTPRTLLLCKGLCLLVGVLLVLDVGDYAEQRMNEANQARLQTAAVRGIDRGANWPQQAQLHAVTQEQWRAGLWRAQTVGAAAAQVQAELTKLADDLGLNSRAVVQPDILERDGQTLLQFTMSVVGRPYELPPVIAALTLQQPRVVLTAASIGFQGRRSNVRVSGYAVIEIASDTTDEAGNDS